LLDQELSNQNTGYESAASTYESAASTYESAASTSCLIKNFQIKTQDQQREKICIIEHK